MKGNEHMDEEVKEVVEEVSEDVPAIDTAVGDDNPGSDVDNSDTLHNSSELGTGSEGSLHPEPRSSDSPADGSDTTDDGSEEEIDIKTLGSMVSTVKDTVEMMARVWLETAKTFQITDKINRRIAEFNSEHKTPVPPELTEEERENWDYLNGLDKLTMEDALQIFGEGHPCIKETIEETIGTVKDVFGSFFTYAVQRREYENIRSAFLMYVDDEEVKQIKSFEEQLKTTENPELKSVLSEKINSYYRMKHLTFLSEPLGEVHINRIKTGLVDPKKAEYWLERCQEKLKQLKVNPDFVLMLYHFEEKNLEEKYWKLNNCLLIHFMSLAIYADMHDTRDERMNMVKCMFVAINSIWTGMLKDSDRQEVMKNIKAFEDQLIDVIEENLEAPETIRPL